MFQKKLDQIENDMKDSEFILNIKIKNLRGKLESLLY